MSDKAILERRVRDAERDRNYAEDQACEAETRLSRARQNLEYADVAEDVVQAVKDLELGIRTLDEVYAIAKATGLW